MAYFVTGGTGLLGVNLIRQLTESGHRVKVLVRQNSKKYGLDSELIEFVQGDVTDSDSINRAIEGCDTVFHLAAWVQISPWGLEQAVRVNVEGTRNVTDAALKQGVKKFIHASSIATIGAGTKQKPANEDTPWDINIKEIPYYKTKKDSELLVLEKVKEGLPAVVVNPTYLVGPWDIKPSSGRMLMKIANRLLRFYPSRGGINYVDVRDAVRGHLLAAEKGKIGERYILGGENLTFHEYVVKVATIAGVPVPNIKLNFGMMYPVAAFGNMAGQIFPNTFKDVNLAVLRSAFEEHFVTSEKAEKELGYTSRPIDESIRDAFNWFVEHGYMKTKSTPKEPVSTRV